MPTNHSPSLRTPITTIWTHITTKQTELTLPTLEAERNGEATVSVEHIAFDSGGKSEQDGETVIGLTLTNEYTRETSSTAIAYLRVDEAKTIGTALVQAATDHNES